MRSYTSEVELGNLTESKSTITKGEAVWMEKPIDTN